MNETPAQFVASLERLRSLAERMAKTSFSTNVDIDLFPHCLRAAFVKAFEFVCFAAAQKPDHAFLLTATLRGITEDFIVLRFLSDLSPGDRQLVCKHLTGIKYAKRIKQQRRFFATFRPHQPAVSGDIDNDSAALRAYWRAHGWPGQNRVMPPTREMARRADPGILEVVYDFVFRLTSSVVHFDPPVLLRSGWGEIPDITFSTQHLGPYYHAVCIVYGSYILCLYCEAFEEEFDPSEEERGGIEELRRQLLLQTRWPEMVTFEEMNLTVPKIPLLSGVVVKSLYDQMQADGFLAGARAILNREQNKR